MTKVTELAIVKKVMAILELGDAGKIGSFFNKQKSKADKAIRDLRRNKLTLKNIHKDDIEDLNDSLEDLNESLADAYLNVTPKDVKNHEAMSLFEVSYWDKISKLKASIETVKGGIEECKEAYVKSIEDVDSQIAKYKENLEIFSQK